MPLAFLSFCWLHVIFTLFVLFPIFTARSFPFASHSACFAPCVCHFAIQSACFARPLLAQCPLASLARPPLDVCLWQFLSQSSVCHLAPVHFLLVVCSRAYRQRLYVIDCVYNACFALFFYLCLFCSFDCIIYRIYLLWQKKVLLF